MYFFSASAATVFFERRQQDPNTFLSGQDIHRNSDNEIDHWLYGCVGLTSLNILTSAIAIILLICGFGVHLTSLVRSLVVTDELRTDGTDKP